MVVPVTPWVFDRACPSCGFLNRREARFCGECGLAFGGVQAVGRPRAVKAGLLAFFVAACAIAGGISMVMGRREAERSRAAMEAMREEKRLIENERVEALAKAAAEKRRHEQEKAALEARNQELEATARGAKEAAEEERRREGEARVKEETERNKAGSRKDEAKRLSAAKPSELNRDLPHAVTLGEDDKSSAELPNPESLSSSDPEIHFKLGVARHQKRDYLKALKSYDRALALKGAPARILQRRSETSFQMGDVARAEIDLRSAIEIEPKNGALYSALASIRLRSRDYNQAERDLGRASEAGADDYPYHLIRGLLHGNQKRYRPAVDELKKAVAKDEASAEVHAFLCRAYRLARDPKKALRACSRAIDLDPKHAEAHIDRGFARIVLSDFAGAAMDFEAGHRLGAHSAPAQLARSAAHAALRQYRESDEAYRVALDMDSLARGTELDFDGTPLERPDYDGLMASLDKVIEVDAGNPYSYLVQANRLHNGGYFDRAIMDYTRALEVDGDIAAAYLGRGTALAAQESWDAAELDFRRAIELDPHGPQGHVRLLTLLAVRRRYADGLLAAAAALKAVPKNPEVYVRAGNLRYFLKDVARAQVDYNLALIADPEYADAHNGLGLCRFAERSYAQAIELFSRAITLNPRNDRFYRNRAGAYINLRQFFNAAADYKIALAVNTDPTMVEEYRKLIGQAAAAGEGD